MIDAFDRTYSRFRDDSLVSRIAKEQGTYAFPDDADMLVGFYKDLYDVTDGAVSPLVGGVLAAAGYDETYSLRPGDVHVAPRWEDTMRWHDGMLETTRPALLDFGAAGKGRLVDLVGEILEDGGLRNYVIDASGDMRVRGSGEIVGLENPTDLTRVIGTIPVADASLCASATNRRAWGQWHHVVDPRTATPTRSVVATWVMASSTMVADGLATALFFVPAQQLQRWSFTYVRLLADGTVERSADYVGELYV